MDRPLILHCFSPIERPEDQTQTLQFLDKLRSERNVTVVDIPCHTQTDYSDAWASYWDYPGPLLNLEHDIVPNIEAFDKMVNCPRKLCTQAYKIYPVSSALKVDVFVQRTASLDSIRYDRWIRESDDECDFTGLGFVKLEIDVRNIFPLDIIRKGNAGWTGWDFTVSNAFYVRGERWHVHWPAIVHNHR